MLKFLKKIVGLPTDEEIVAAKSKNFVPVVNNKTGDIVDIVPLKNTVNDQITDSVTQATPTKKPRKPRTPKVEKIIEVKPVKEKAAKEKAAKPVKAVAAKRAYNRSKKA